MDNNQNQNDSLGMSIILVVLALLVLVGGLIWFFTRGGAELSDNNTEAAIEINIPETNDR
ncbi:MAG: hypothetical protein WDZ73_01635 [Candidatus Paceibacterota bacterium]